MVTMQGGYLMRTEKVIKIMATIGVLAVVAGIAFAIHPAKVPIWGKALALLAIGGIWGNKWS